MTAPAKSLEGTVLDVILAVYNANPNGVQAAIAAGEGGLTTFVTNAIKSIPAKGIAAIVLPYIESGIEAYVAQLVATYTPAEIYTLVGSWLAAEAKAAGG